MLSCLFIYLFIFLFFFQINETKVWKATESLKLTLAASEPASPDKTRPSSTTANNAPKPTIPPTPNYAAMENEELKVSLFRRVLCSTEIFIFLYFCHSYFSGIFLFKFS